MRIVNSVYQELLAAAREEAPLEACGILAGVDDVATTFYRLTNADKSAEHFSMIPEEQFAAVKDMRTKGLGMLTIWHSHPASPARMSDEDIKLAYTPDTLYTILSLADPSAPAIASYVMDGDNVPVKVETTVDME